MKGIKSVQKWFQDNISEDGKSYTLDKHQAAIILDSHQNTIVTARAGSGKTRTLVAKIIYLITHDNIPPSKIIVFAFNRKACTEINERLQKIQYQDQPILSQKCQIATTFHAYAYKMLGGNRSLKNRLLTAREEDQIIFNCLKKSATSKNQISELFTLTKQFIIRAEQLYFLDYSKLSQAIQNLPDSEQKTTLIKLEHIFYDYQEELRRRDHLNFNQLIAEASKLQLEAEKYSYILVDEYQDFSLLFLELIKSLRRTNPTAHLLVVGDDWQAINRFAGSDVKYFQHFTHFFPEDSCRLFIPTNYRSDKKIVKSANFFMSSILNDYQGCKAKSKIKGAKIFIKDIEKLESNFPKIENSSAFLKSEPLLLKNYLNLVAEIIKAHPGKTIKILHRNNDLSFAGWSLASFCQTITKHLIKNKIITEKESELITFSTIHRSKGLESDIVILLEIDANKFPGKDKTNGLFEIFGDNTKTIFEDEARLFYVALTRPKEKLYILSKTVRPSQETKKCNFLEHLNPDLIEYL